MNKMNRLLLIGSVALLGLSACGSSETTTSSPSSERFLFTSSNATAGNRIVTLEINSDGSLTEIDQDANMPGVQASPTGGFGDSAEGDFDGQESLHIIGNYLLAVNAGANFIDNGSISVFSINNTGALTRVDQNPANSAIDNIDSGGIRPVSISSVDRDGVTWVLVANQHSNPHFGVDANEILDSNGNAATIVTSADRNIHAFTFSDGVLSSIGTVATYDDGQWGGPATVAFSPNGDKVAVSTWGVAQFGAGITTTSAVQGESRVYFYDVTYDPTTPALTLAAAGIFEQEGISGSIGLSWNPDSDSVFVANFNLDANTDLQNGVTVLDANGATGANTFDTVLFSAGIGDGTNGNEVCWTWLSPDGMRLYTASFASNKVTYFNVDTTTQQITFNQSITRILQTNAPDTKDIFIPKNGRNLYVSGALETHTISLFEIDNSGMLSENDAAYTVPSALDANGANVDKNVQAFLGLVGY